MISKIGESDITMISLSLHVNSGRACMTIHSSIVFQNVGLHFPHKICFEGLTTQITYGSRIAIIGRNGSGKSTLLKMLQGLVEPSEGFIKVPDNVVFGYVPQIVQDFDEVSGGQRFNKALSQVLALDPNVLLLDEPTNHLDARNRRSLMRMLRNFQGTLIIVSHDVELLRTCIDTLWHIDEGSVHIFSGNYDDYQRERGIAFNATSKKIEALKKEKKKAREALQFEQERSAQSRQANKNEHDRVLKGAMQERGEQTAGKKKGKVHELRDRIESELRGVRVSEVIKPKFSLTAADVGGGTIVSISDGACGYEKPVLHNISLSVGSHERIVFMGDNGSGKSTLVKAILGEASVKRSGNWFVPKRNDIGYLDQHYNNINAQQTVLDNVLMYLPGRSHVEVRTHLNDFLFRKNEEVMVLASTLSGGEKVRLSLACIAAKTPKLLILDEITNNLDLETREHVIQVLKDYPGAMIIISHDEDFICCVGVNTVYEIDQGALRLSSMSLS